MITESTIVYSNKEIVRVLNDLQNIAHEMGASINAIEHNNQINQENDSVELAVVLSGKGGLADSLKHIRLGSFYDTWAVQVIVYKKEYEVHKIQLVALGEINTRTMTFLPKKQELLSIKLSTDKMNYIAEELKTEANAPVIRNDTDSFTDNLF